jgi:hypothetical protein
VKGFVATALLVVALSGCAQGSSVAYQPLGSGRGDASADDDGSAERDSGGGHIGLPDGGTGSDAGGPPADGGGVSCVPAAEVCNGLDDDCDGAVDDDGACPCDVAERDGHAYLFCGDELGWETARTRCQTLGYDLAVIGDAMEDDFVFGQIDARAFHDTWIGMNDRTTEDTWQWIDGTPFAYRHWDDGEPNDGGDSGEDCGLIMTRDGRETEWDDRDCGDPYPYVCETL